MMLAMGLWWLACTTAPVAEPTTDKEYLTEPQRKKLVDFTQALCATRWCAGDYEFLFLGVSCDKSTWTCKLGAIGWPDVNPKQRKDLQCEVGAVLNVKQLLLKRKTTEMWNEALDNCLGAFKVPDMPAEK